MTREEQFEAGQASAIPRIRELEAKNVELEKKLKELEDKETNKRIDLMSLANTHTKAVKYIATLEKKLEIAVEALEDFILENDHLPACVYKNGFGYAYECKCMDRNYYNKDAVMIRARKALAAINGEGI